MKLIFGKRLTAVFFIFTALVVFTGECRANGNVSADEPAPIKKSVRKATIKKPVRKAAPRKTPQKESPRPILQPQPGSLERGISLMEQEKYRSARPWLQKAVQEERGNPYAWYWYGLYHEKTGQFEQARFFYTKALEQDPAFPPLSRVVVYPDDGERKPLWDPRRPARIYPVPTETRGIAIVPPDAPEAEVRPSAPAVDPMVPKVPVYIPPEPTAAASPGDAEQLPVYVPPVRGAAAQEIREDQE